MYIVFFYFLIKLSYGEWELPEELRPPKELFERIAGYSSFIGYKPIPDNLLTLSVKTYLSESVETKYSSIIFDPISDNVEFVFLYYFYIILIFDP